MVSVRLTVDTAPLEGITDYLSTREAEVIQITETIYRRRAPNIIALLKRTPGRATEFKAKTEKQRRFVMAMLTRQAKASGRYPDISYQRTGRAADSWVWRMSPSRRGDSRGVGLTIASEWEASQFVYGTLNQRSLSEAAQPQQPFHKGRWPLAAGVAKQGFDEIQAEVEAELKAADKKAFKLILKKRSRRPVRR